MGDDPDSKTINKFPITLFGLLWNFECHYIIESHYLKLVVNQPTYRTKKMSTYRAAIVDQSISLHLLSSALSNIKICSQNFY